MVDAIVGIRGGDAARRGVSRRTVLGQMAGCAALAGLGGALAGCSRASAPGAVKIANASGGLSLVMNEMMKEQGYLQSFGLHPTLMHIADGTKILGGIVGGSADASMMSGFSQTFPAMLRGADIKIIGGGILLPSLAMFTGNAQVNSVKDLEGKSIGTGSIGALVYQLTVTLLKKYGVDPAKVRFVNIGSSPDVFRAVSAGTVDAGLAQASLAATSAAHHVRPVQNGNLAVEVPQFTYQGAWTSAQEIATKRDTVVKSLAAYAKMYRYVQTPAAKNDFIKARRTAFPSAPQAEHEAEWQFVQTFKPFAVDLVLSPDRIAYMQNLNEQFDQQKTLVPYERATDMSLARDAIALLARS